MNLQKAFIKNFLGNSPDWFKWTIVGFLILNPLLLLLLGDGNVNGEGDGSGLNGPFIVGWILILEFIFCLAMALKCYPLQPGGLLAIEAVRRIDVVVRGERHRGGGHERDALVRRPIQIIESIAKNLIDFISIKLAEPRKMGARSIESGI